MRRPSIDLVFIRISCSVVIPFVNVYVSQVTVLSFYDPLVAHSSLHAFFHEKQIQGDGTYAEFIGNHRRGKPFPIFDSLSVMFVFVAVGADKLVLCAYGLLLALDQSQRILIVSRQWLHLFHSVCYGLFRIGCPLLPIERNISVSEQGCEFFTAPCTEGRREPFCELHAKMNFEPRRSGGTREVMI